RHAVALCPARPRAVSRPAARRQEQDARLSHRLGGEPHRIARPPARGVQGRYPGERRRDRLLPCASLGGPHAVGRGHRDHPAAPGGRRARRDPAARSPGLRRGPLRELRRRGDAVRRFVLTLHPPADNVAPWEARRLQKLRATVLQKLRPLVTRLVAVRVDRTSGIETRTYEPKVLRTATRKITPWRAPTATPVAVLAARYRDQIFAGIARAADAALTRALESQA